ncbi:hypothetical protein SAMN02745824_1275 [Parasphingorhabdus marina DSM 22363]|uniref:Uncharacterized protein n=1 Tax=Parasphingorhabdus marina DSM 22363 TaxID=1123272 RepID=A0A1N6CYT7_9SPHN|nr:hypothetical protein [Parasphingorhabdus marina]SIN63682.1 hypothetical protein SAMN02745824_1275 [Parasphingorhabdus marina DSM 22363]
MNNISRTIIQASALGGAIYAGLTIFAIIHGFEYYVMGMLLAAVLMLVLRHTPGSAFRNGFVGGFTAILTAVWVQALFLPLYFQNNPEYAVSEVPWGLSARSFTFLTAPLGALVAGLVLAMLAAGLARLVRQTPPGSGH